MDHPQDTSPPPTITVLGFDDSRTDRGFMDRHLVRRVVNSDQLADQIRSFMEVMKHCIGKLDQQVGQYEVDSITVSAEINAKGNVSLLGIGGEVGGQGGLSLTFKRSSTHKTDE